MPKKIKYIKVKGDHYEIGLKIGKSTRNEIHRCLEVRRKRYASPSFRVKTLYNLVNSNSTYSNYIEELRGIADGSQQNFMDIFAINCDEMAGCTTVLVKSRERYILGHNEDEDPDENYMYLLNAEYENGDKYTALSYVGLLAGQSVSINGNNLIQALDFVRTDKKLGIPPAFVARSTLDAKNMKEAVKLATKPAITGGTNIFFVQKSKAVDVERAFNHSFVTKIGNSFAHTNHYLSKSLLKYWHPDGELTHFSSTTRYSTAKRMLAEGEKSAGTIKEILSSHDKVPGSICNHKLKKFIWSVTLASIVIDTTNMDMEIAHGTPCNTIYIPFRN